MTGLQITIDEKGLDLIAKQADPKQVYTIMMTWYDRASQIMARELRARTPSRLRGKVRIKMDKLRPPRWCRIDVRSGLAHVIEGGTGTMGDPAFHHRPRHFPPWTGEGGLMETMGLSKPAAFAVALSIFKRGGNPPRPFVRPAFQAGLPQVQALMGTIIKEVMGS